MPRTIRGSYSSKCKTLSPYSRNSKSGMKNGGAAGPSGDMQEFQGFLGQLKDVMERLAKKLNPTGIRKVSSRVTWSLWGKEDVLEGLRTIERFKSLLIAWLGMDISTSVQDITSALEDAADNQRMNHDGSQRPVYSQPLSSGCAARDLQIRLGCCMESAYNSLC
ncbi:hypothetical protein B0H14DRAFT_33564 [Mycena olivaceomarginata]|nr:hypothetical protein B0H14DRAFT_33564 [Mycena olivaceomarginata]